MSLCAVVFVLASISIQNCAGMLTVNVSASGTLGVDPAPKSGSFNYGSTGYRFGFMDDPIVIGTQSFNYYYAISQEQFASATGLQIAVPFPADLTLHVIDAKRQIIVGSGPDSAAAATPVVIGGVLLHTFLVSQDDFTSDVSDNVDIFLDLYGDPSSVKWFQIVKIKKNATANSELMKKLQPCVLLFLSTDERP